VTADTKVRLKGQAAFSPVATDAEPSPAPHRLDATVSSAAPPAYSVTDDWPDGMTGWALVDPPQPSIVKSTKVIIVVESPETDGFEDFITDD